MKISADKLGSHDVLIGIRDLTHTAALIRHIENNGAPAVLRMVILARPALRTVMKFANEHVAVVGMANFSHCELAHSVRQSRLVDLAAVAKGAHALALDDSMLSYNYKSDVKTMMQVRGWI